MDAVAPSSAPWKADVPLQQTRGLTKSFRGFQAVNAVDLTISEGTAHALDAPNGAGKTTLFHLLTGILSPSSGSSLHRRIRGRGGDGVVRLRPAGALLSPSGSPGSWPSRWPVSPSTLGGRPTAADAHGPDPDVVADLQVRSIA